MTRTHRRGEPALAKTGYFEMMQCEQEAVRSAAKAVGLSASAYVRHCLDLDAPYIGTRDQHRGPSHCFCGIAVAEASRLCPELD